MSAKAQHLVNEPPQVVDEHPRTKERRGSPLQIIVSCVFRPEWEDWLTFLHRKPFLGYHQCSLRQVWYTQQHRACLYSTDDAGQMNVKGLEIADKRTMLTAKGPQASTNTIDPRAQFILLTASARIPANTRVKNMIFQWWSRRYVQSPYLPSRSTGRTG